MKVAVFYSVLPIALHCALLASFFIWRPLWALPLSHPSFVLGGIVFLPYLTIYALSLICRRGALKNNGKAQLFIRGSVNPFPAMGLAWIAFWVMIVAHR
jgi:hypothetical protein